MFIFLRAKPKPSITNSPTKLLLIFFFFLLGNQGKPLRSLIFFNLFKKSNNFQSFIRYNLPTKWDKAFMTTTFALVFRPEISGQQIFLYFVLFLCVYLYINTNTHTYIHKYLYICLIRKMKVYSLQACLRVVNCQKNHLTAD